MFHVNPLPGSSVTGSVDGFILQNLQILFACCETNKLFTAALTLALRKNIYILYNFGHSECNRVN